METRQQSGSGGGVGTATASSSARRHRPRSYRYGGCLSSSFRCSRRALRTAATAQLFLFSPLFQDNAPTLSLPLVLAQPASIVPTPAGLTPEQSEQQQRDGKIGGTHGAYFRYYHVYMNAPGEKEEAEAVTLADEIRCDVCTVITHHAMEKFAQPPTAEEEVSSNGTSHYSADDPSVHPELRGKPKPPGKTAGPPFDWPFRLEERHEELLLEELEGHMDDDTEKELKQLSASEMLHDGPMRAQNELSKSGVPVDEVRIRVLSKKKGCNKLFKDYFLYKGWRIEACRETDRILPEHRRSLDERTACLGYDADPPSDHSINTYELWKEGVFFGCEQSIGRYRDEIVSYLSDRAGRGRKRWDLAEEACQRAAKCGPKLGRGKGSRSGGGGSGGGRKKGAGGGAKKVKTGGGAKKKEGGKKRGKTAPASTGSTSSVMKEEL